MKDSVFGKKISKNAWISNCFIVFVENVPNFFM